MTSIDKTIDVAYVHHADFRISPKIRNLLLSDNHAFYYNSYWEVCSSALRRILILATRLGFNGIFWQHSAHQSTCKNVISSCNFFHAGRDRFKNCTFYILTFPERTEKSFQDEKQSCNKPKESGNLRRFSFRPRILLNQIPILVRILFRRAIALHVIK